MKGKDDFLPKLYLMNEQEIDFEFNFSDVTIIEADGVFEEVDRLFQEGDDFYGKKIPLGYRKKSKTSGLQNDPEDWMIETTLTIDSVYGMGAFVIHFFSDRRVIIDAYQSSGGDVYYNPDLPALSGWVQAKGWMPPQPALALVKSNLEFWKYHWQNKIIDSPYLDEVFGERPNMITEEMLAQEKKGHK